MEFKNHSLLKKVNNWSPFKFGILIVLAILLITYITPILSILKTIYGVLFPIFLGLVLAYILNLIMKRYEKIWFPKSTNKFIVNSRRGICIVLTLLTILAVITFVLWIIIPQVISSANGLIDNVPLAFNRFTNNALSMTKGIPEVHKYLRGIIPTTAQIIGKIIKYGQTFAGGIFNFVGSTFSGIFTFSIAIIFAIYILGSKETLARQFHLVLNAYIPEKKVEKINKVLKVADISFSSYFVGQLMEAILIGTFTFIGMLIFKFPYAPIVSTIIAFTAFIPMIGAYIGAFIAAILIATSSIVSSLLFLVFLTILQQIEGSVIYPRIMHKSLGLPALWVLGAVTIMGPLFGFTGLFLGVPTVATIYRLLAMDVSNRTLEPWDNIEKDRLLQKNETKDIKENINKKGVE